MKHLRVKHYCIIVSISIFLFISFYGCNKTNKKPITLPGNINYATQIADTIIYDVIIKNPDPEDEWVNYCLQNVDTKKLIAFAFDAVYNNKATAYHYYTNEEFTIEQVKEIESSPDFSRDRIAKIQFVEEWFIDEENLRMYKSIRSIMLGYEIYNDDGRIRGYKPTFRIYLNSEM